MKVVLLDIDGVISPVYSVDRESHSIDIQWAKFVIPKDLAGFIKDLSNQVEIVWASSWEDYSFEVSKELNFNIKKHLNFNDSGKWLKTSKIREYVLANKDKDILLIDDEAQEFLSDFIDLKNLTIISPDDRIGLSKENINEIEKWLKL